MYKKANKGKRIDVKRKPTKIKKKKLIKDIAQELIQIKSAGVRHTLEDKSRTKSDDSQKGIFGASSQVWSW